MLMVTEKEILKHLDNVTDKVAEEKANSLLTTTYCICYGCAVLFSLLVELLYFYVLCLNAEPMYLLYMLNVPMSTADFNVHRTNFSIPISLCGFISSISC